MTVARPLVSRRATNAHPRTYDRPMASPYRLLFDEHPAVTPVNPLQSAQSNPRALVRANITRLRIYGLEQILIDVSSTVTSARSVKFVAHGAVQCDAAYE